MMVLVSKQHKVTTKYKDAGKNRLGEDIAIHKCRESRFCCRQVDFQVTCPAGRIAVLTFVWPSSPKWPSKSPFDDVLIWQTRYRDSKHQNTWSLISVASLDQVPTPSVKFKMLWFDELYIFPRQTMCSVSVYQFIPFYILCRLDFNIWYDQ